MHYPPRKNSQPGDALITRVIMVHDCLKKNAMVDGKMMD